MQLVDGSSINWVRGEGITSRASLGVDCREYPDYIQVKGKKKTLTFHRSQPKQTGFEYRNVTDGKVVSFIMK